MSVEVGQDRSADRITFLLTDIEGSTRRWETDPDRMAQLLEAHDAAIAAEVADAGGQLIKARGEGDSTFAVFADPPAALHAAVACQVRLLGDVGLPVRMALHTGATSERWGEYYGPPANRAARLRSLAAGGRVLLSATTADSVRSSLPPDCQLVDLGVFVLKDLERPERVFGVRHPALPDVLIPRDSLLGTDMLGRDRELGTLRALLADVERSMSRIAVIVGEGGIGKTRLAEVLGREGCAGGGRLVWATAHSDLGAPPFSVWTDLLERLDDTERTTSAPATGPEERPDRETLYHRVVTLLRAAARASVLVVVLDDLHLADPSSLQLLRRIGAERDLGRVFFLAMSRPTPPDHPARQALTHLGRNPHATTIDLGDLPEEACARLLADYAPDLDRKAATEVLRHAGGNPLFLRAYAGAVAQRTGITPLPETVRMAISERLLSVDSAAVTVLEVAAVGGRSIPIDITAGAAGVDEGSVLRALVAGETVGLVSQAAVTVQAWRFTHDIIRDAIVAGIDPAERAAMHGRIGRAIEQLRAEDLAAHAAEIATHFTQATADHWPSGVTYGEMAAQAALRAGAFEEAAGHCRRALSQLAEMGGGAPQRARLLLMLGSGLTADDIEAAGTAILEAIGIARSTGDQDLLIRAIEALPHDMGRLDARAVAELHAVVEQLGESESAVAARLHGHLAIHHYTTRRWDELRREADEAWRLSRQVGDPATRFLGSLGRLLTLWCDPDRDVGRQVLEECTWSAEACTDPSVTLQGRYFRIRPIIEFADRDGFTSTLELLEEGVGGHVATYSQWVATTWRTLEATLDGRFDRAEALLEQSVPMGQAAAGRISLAVQFHQKSMLRHEQGRLAEEIEALDFVDGIWPGHPVIMGWRSLARGAAGDREQAREILAVADDDGFAEIPAQLIFGLAPLTEAAVAIGEGAIAGRLAEALAPRSGYLFVGFGIASACYGAVDRYRGLIATLIGDADAALEHHAAATRLHRRFRTPVWLLHSQLDTATALIARGRSGDVAQASTLVATVTEAAAPTQMWRVQQRAADLRRRLS